MAKKIPTLPKLLRTKIYKTGQTRGADDDVVYQNRVSRASTVLIPFEIWDDVSLPPTEDDVFESGFICLISPTEYFETENIEAVLQSKGLMLGQNALVFYQIRDDWKKHNPEDMGWTFANSRTPPLLGNYVARIAATTAENGERISRGLNTTGMKGAGIRLFEYASKSTIEACRTQLEAAFWLCYDSIESVCEFGMNRSDAIARRDICFQRANNAGLLNYERLREVRITDENHQTICPLCLDPLSSYGFFSRLVQATGRAVHDLTVTEINLFHIHELRYGGFNHRTYNLGWGHHHCNVVVRDSGIDETLQWMSGVLEKNKESGYLD